jgi:hypothetical protein
VKARQNQIDVVGRLREHDHANPVARTVQSLLCRHWMKASWKERADILRNTEWLMRLEHARREGCIDSASMVKADRAPLPLARRS